ncbi:hypothetical protein [Pedobacter nototheniae]|uniref:hypothetical protein n=1 Tax=Pedobacter nototheniae TaxID=2488994 RepID=UPI00293010CF|nr:hypothetical protein [Pedobacter nototheniae]
MNINEALLERYHLNTCTPEERRQVEEWLFNTDTDELAELPPAEDKLKHKAEMWANIETIMPEEKEIVKLRSPGFFMWKGAIAASLFIAVTASLVYFFFLKSPGDMEYVSINNTSLSQVKNVNSSGYDISVGPNTIAKINGEAGIIDLSGSILISPKKDIELLFEGTNKKVILKKGQTYIILDNKSGNQGIVVVSEKNLLDLPPVIQKQISTQFDI